jgi:hypothetical protein
VTFGLGTAASADVASTHGTAIRASSLPVRRASRPRRFGACTDRDRDSIFNMKTSSWGDPMAAKRRHSTTQHGTGISH